MKISSLDKRNSESLKTSLAKMAKVVYQDVDYYIFAMKVKDIEIPYFLDINGESLKLLDKNFSYVELLPIGKNYSLKVYYNANDSIIAIKCDITLNNFLDERKMPFYEEGFLSIVLDSKYNIYEYGKNDLKEALEKKEITEDEYNKILREFSLSLHGIKENINMLKRIVYKYLNALLKENNNKKKPISEKDNANTYKTNIKPGIKVAIVLKKDQKTGILTEGIVKDILTNSAVHHRGIKVRLTDGSVGRVQKIL